MSSSLSHYRTALTTPGALAPVLNSLLGRLPIAMIGLSLLLYVQRDWASEAAPPLLFVSPCAKCISLAETMAPSICTRTKCVLPQ